MVARYPAAELTTLATELLLRAGLGIERAEAVVAILVEGDLLGHTTHGLALLPGYLADICSAYPWGTSHFNPILGNPV
jgi:LDH2 family malate/lactate/ureidoglycolate dehydrogenase